MIYVVKESDTMYDWHIVLEDGDCSNEAKFITAKTLEDALDQLSEVDKLRIIGIFRGLRY